LAISGLHIGILIVIFNWIFLKLKIFKIQRNILILIVLNLYYLSINISPSVTRAYIMGTIFLLGNIFSENSSMKKSFSIALVINLAIFPNSFKEVSFILSYGAVLGIILITPYLFKIQNYFKDKLGKYWLKLLNYILFTFFLQLFLSPILLIYFKDYSFKSIFYSMILTPLGTLYIILSFLSLIFPLIPLNNLCYNILIKFIESII
ncbi:MAG: ComEC/Rec2 family competence protein, partial [Fusobacteriaceae bacterium]